MEQMDLIKAIAELGVLIVIAGLYLYERFMSNRDSVEVLKDLKALLTRIDKNNYDKSTRTLELHDLHSVISLYLSSQECELIRECDQIVTINHIHEDEARTAKRVQEMVERVHERHKDYIDDLTYKGRAVKDILGQEEFLRNKTAICVEWVLDDNRKALNLYRNLERYFEYFKISIE